MFIDNFQRPIYYIDLPKYTLILYTWVIIYWIIKEKASSFPHILNLNYYWCDKNRVSLEVIK